MENLDIEVPQQEQQKRNPLKALIAGGLCGVINLSLTYPLNYLKTTMQLYPEMARNGLLYSFRYSISQFGFIGLYRGISSLYFFTIPTLSLRFSTYEYLRNNVFTGQSSVNQFMCGLTSGTIEAILIVTPSETLKVLLIHDRMKLNTQNKNLTTTQRFRSIYEHQGLRGFYKGLGPCIMRQATSWAIRFAVYDYWKKQLSTVSYLPEFLKRMIAGSIAGIISCLGNAPFDLLKVKMQGLDSHQYNGIIDCAKKVYKNDGFLGFYHGIKPRVINNIIDMCILLPLYDYISEFIIKVWPDEPPVNKNQNKNFSTQNINSKNLQIEGGQKI